jgi:hypothetical protein
VPTKADPQTGEIEESTACELDVKATVAERWHWVLAHLPGIGKDSRNTQQNFSYRSIDAVLKEVKPLFAKAGVFVLPARQKATHVEWQGQSGKAVHVTRLEVMWQIYGVCGDHISAETVGEAADAFDKATSKAQTAAFKYLLWPSLAIADNDDNDGQTPEPTVHRGTLKAVSEGGAALRDRVDTMQPPLGGPDKATMPQVNKVRIDCRNLGYAEEGTEVVEAVNSFGEPGWPGSLIKLEKWQASRLIDFLNQ